MYDRRHNHLIIYKHVGERGYMAKRDHLATFCPVKQGAMSKKDLSLVRFFHRFNEKPLVSPEEESLYRFTSQRAKDSKNYKRTGGLIFSFNEDNSSRRKVQFQGFSRFRSSFVKRALKERGRLSIHCKIGVNRIFGHLVHENVYRSVGLFFLSGGEILII